MPDPTATGGGSGASGGTRDTRPTTSPRLDRVSARRRAGSRVRDGSGTEALYSTAPTAPPPAQVELRCRHCDARYGLPVAGVLSLLTRPFVWDPMRGRVWTRCPACERRAWLELRAGEALRVLVAQLRPRR